MMDTLSLLPDDWAGKFDSRYRVVLVAAQRAKYLMQGAKRSQLSKFTKETSVALEEVLQGNVEFLMGKEARQALKEVRKTVEREFDESLLGETDEDAKEIKKQLSVYIDDSPKEEVVESEIHE